MIFSNKEKSPSIPLYERGRRQFSFPLFQRGTKGDLASPSRSLAALLLGCGALLIAPQVALADNECGTDPSANGNTADSIVCPFGDYSPDGITHVSDGDLHIDFDIGESDGDPNTTPNTTTVSDYGTGGTVTTAGNAGDNLSLFVTGNYNSNIFSSQAFPVLFDVESQAGDIDLVIDPDVEDFDIATSAATTHLIRLISTAGGNVTLSGGGSDGRGGIVNSGNTGVEASSLGGSGHVNIDLKVESIRGGDYGVRAETENDGSINISLGGGGARGGISGIRAESDTGAIAINANGSLSSDPANVAAIHALTAGTIDITTARARGGDAIGILTENSPLVTIDIDGSSASGSSRGVSGETAAIRAVGTDVVVNATDNPLSSIFEDIDDLAGIHGGLDFTGLTGHAEINIQDNGVWQLATGDGTPSSVFSGGADTVSIEPGGIAYMDQRINDSTPAQEVSVVDFGAGSDTVTNAGLLLVAPHTSNGAGTEAERAGYEGEMRFDNLDTFNNSGTIYLGAVRQNTNPIVTTTDGNFDDILSLPGADFVGSGDSRIELDAFLNNVGSPDDVCGDASRNTEGDLPASDCIDLRNGTASGRTEIVFNMFIPGDRGALNPDGTLIVDLAGGSADPDAFVVSPDTEFYSPQFGGVIDKGLFFFPLAYDAETQQFRLYGQPSTAGQQIPIMGNVVNELWRTSADAWFGRRVDQRHVEKEAGLGGGVWMRATADAAERDVATPIIAGTQTFEFDNSYTQDNSAVTLGADLIARSDGNMAWVVGPMLGYARSRVDFDAHPNWANLEGLHFGLYGSLTLGDFFLDAAINVAELDMDYDAPVLELFPEGTLLGTDITSLGGQVEAGWGGLKFGRLGIEPLASLSYVTSSIEDVNVPAGDPTRPGGNFEFDDPTSFRGGLGARLSVANVLPGLVPTDVSLTARAVEEFEGDSTATITSTGPIPVDQTDTLDGTFMEVTGSVSVSNAAKTVAGYLNVDGTFESDYESVGVEAGFRYQW